MDRKILVIEDDFALAMGLNYTLKADGYLTDHAKNLKEAREFLLKEKNYSLIILDVMLPDGDGFSFLEEFMQMNIDIPVIFSTAVSDEANIVRGLDLGADDYITKPYRVKELLARIAAVIRRHERGRNNTKASEDFIYFGEHKFSESSLRLYIGDELIDCTPAELRLLREFLNNKGIVLTRNLLMERLYDTENSFIDDNTLSVYIKRLRDKLGEDAGFIKTVKGVGYRFGE
ncbi:MAG: response regulator transcription factor [Eubacterium sp.]|nr:response regulator transcription factor [Eubacterium sp.]